MCSCLSLPITVFRTCPVIGIQLLLWHLCPDGGDLAGIMWSRSYNTSANACDIPRCIFLSKSRNGLTCVQWDHVSVFVALQSRCLFCGMFGWFSSEKLNVCNQCPVIGQNVPCGEKTTPWCWRRTGVASTANGLAIMYVTYNSGRPNLLKSLPMLVSISGSRQFIPRTNVVRVDNRYNGVLGKIVGIADGSRTGTSRGQVKVRCGCYEQIFQLCGFLDQRPFCSTCTMPLHNLVLCNSIIELNQDRRWLRLFSQFP